jgi:hypothetical protein
MVLRVHDISVRHPIVSIAPAPVAQRELETVVALDNQVRSLQTLRDRQCVAIVAKLMAGARIEPGAYSAQLRSEESGAAQVFCLVVNGKDFR